MKSFKRLLLIFSTMLMFGIAESAYSQCSVCRAGAESNLNSKTNKRGAGLNNAILYLMSVPYVMAGVGGFIWWKNRKKA